MHNLLNLVADGLQQLLLSAKNRNLKLQQAQTQQQGSICISVEAVDERINSMIHRPNLSCVNSPGWWCVCNGVGNVFLAHFGPLNTNQSWFECHSLSADYMTLFMATIHLLMADNMITHHIIKWKSSQTGFTKLTVSTVYFNGLPSPQIYISVPPGFRKVFFVTIAGKNVWFCWSFSQKLWYNLQCFMCSYCSEIASKVK